MASIRKIIRNGKVVGWQATISCGRDANNKQIREYVTRDTAKECKSAAREIEQDYEEGKLSKYSNMKFSIWAAKYLKITKPPALSPTTYRYNKGCINNYFIPYFKNIKLSNITDIHIREFLAYERKCISPKTKQKLAEATIKKHFAILSHMLGMALKSKNPCLEIEKIDGDSKPRYVPTVQEFNRLLKAVQGMWDEIPILLAAWCGMREGEIFDIKVNDVFVSLCIIKIDENRAIAEVEDIRDVDEDYSGPKYEYVDKDPKSKNGIRNITISEYLMGLIEKRISELGLKGDDRLFEMRPDSYCKRFPKLIYYHNLMLTNKPTGKMAPFSKKSIPRLLHIQKEPIPVFSFHSLRHYHATVLFEEGYPDLYAAFFCAVFVRYFVDRNPRKVELVVRLELTTCALRMRSHCVMQYRSDVSFLLCLCTRYFIAFCTL